jgi:hypothetical protein
MKTTELITKPDWCFIRLDETSFWNMPADVSPYVKHVFGIYAFNRNEQTYCCEITPSYFLQLIAHDWEHTSELYDLPNCEQLREVAADFFTSVFPSPDSDQYYHVSLIKKLIAADPAGFHAAGDIADPDSDEHEINMLCEYWNPNPKF